MSAYLVTHSIVIACVMSVRPRIAGKSIRRCTLRSAPSQDLYSELSLQRKLVLSTQP